MRIFCSYSYAQRVEGFIRVLTQEFAFKWPVFMRIFCSFSHA
jgi:hypothetical protein